MAGTDTGSATVGWAIGRGRVSRWRFITRNMNTEQEDERLEPFTTVMELANEYGNLEVIIAIQQLLAFQLEEDACCTTCQRKAEWWSREMSSLVARYEREFPEMGAVAMINHAGVGQVQ
jgi:hypothetical protein